MTIRKYSLGQLQANCYLLAQDKDCILVDPADDAGFLLEEISRQNLNLKGMFATHGHFDHVMATGEIQLSLDVPLYIHTKDLFLIRRLKATAKHFLGYEPFVIQPKNVKSIGEGAFALPSFKLKVLETPGHTPGGCCFYFPEEQSLFTGDTLFAGAVGRTDLSYSSSRDLAVSLLKIFDLPEETEVFAGHGEETSILNEKKEF